MTMTELTFSLRHPNWEDEREEVTLWVPSPENDSSHMSYEPEDISDKPRRRWVGIGPWTSFDKYAWPIEPTPSNLVATLSKEVGFFRGGNVTGYIDEFGEWIEDPTKEYLQERIEVEEYCEAYDKWTSEYGGMMEDIYQKSRFIEWDLSRGCSSYYGVCDPTNMGHILEYTPEALVQRFNLNWRFNFEWNQPLAHWENHHEFGFRFADVNKCITAEKMDIPQIIEDVEFIRYDKKYGLGNSSLGKVYIPLGSVNYLVNRDKSLKKFRAELVFTGEKYPWRVGYKGIKKIY